MLNSKSTLWKTCVQAVGKTQDACGQYISVLHSKFFGSKHVWITTLFVSELYTFCIRQYTAIVGNFTSVKDRLYTQYTGLTNTTTN